MPQLSDREEVLSLTPLFQRLLACRGLEDPAAIRAFLSGDPAGLGDPFQIKGMDKAVWRIRLAVQNSEKILVHGDYDADGVTGTAVAAKTLEALGASFSTFLPDRVKDGYGVSLRAIREASQNQVKILITVDCGISAFDAFAEAKRLGLEVIVIDHHQISSRGLPPADIILNPHQEDCSYAFKGLSAAGLAFKLASALIGNRAEAFLDLVALSTVCDVAPLVEENRTLVKQGLRALALRRNPGLKALSEVSGIRSQEIDISHVAFMLGPRINAAGRMSSPEIALRLLLTPSEKEAGSLAKILNEENKLRQKEERQVVKEALAEVERTIHFNRDRVIVVGREGWHQGVIGIVASRLVERYHRPAVVVAFTKGRGKGSGRSAGNFHLQKAFQACSEFLEAHGGHAQAAGLEVFLENFQGFRKRLNEYAEDPANQQEQVCAEDTADLEVALDEFSTPFVRELKMLEPHGIGNPKPVFFSRNLRLKGNPEAQRNENLKVWLTDGTRTYEALWRGGIGYSQADWLGAGSLKAVYTIRIQTRDGLETVVLDLKHLSPE